MHLAYINELSRLDESLTYFDTCLDEVIWKTDANGYITYLASQPDNVIINLKGFSLTKWRNFIHPEDLKSLLFGIARAKERKAMFIERVHVVGSYLRIRSFLVLGTPRFSKDNTLLGYSGTLIKVDPSVKTAFAGI